MKKPKPTPKRRLLLALALAGIAAVGALVALQTRAPETSDGVVSSTTDPTVDDEEARALQTLQSNLKNSLVLPADFRQIPQFTLSDVDGEPLTEAMFDDRWSLMFFGFTSCPDVCPTTLSVVNGVVERLGEVGAEPPQVVFVTVDPARDSASRMKDYVAFFNEDFIGVTGEQNALHELTSELGIVVAFTANDDDPDAYTVDHTASLLLVDPERRVRAKLSAPHDVETIVSDYLELRAGLAELN